MMQEQEHRGNFEKVRRTTKKPEITCEEMFSTIRDVLSDHALSDNEEDGDEELDDEEDTGHSQLCEDDEPGWVMGTVTKSVYHRMEIFQQMQMSLDELTQPGWVEAVDYICDRHMRYSTTELKLPAVGKLQTDLTAGTPSPTTFRELMQALDVVPRQLSQMPQVSSDHGSSQIRLGSYTPYPNNPIVPPMPVVVPDLSQLEIGKPVLPIIFDACM
jgi:hypothetical protein